MSREAFPATLALIRADETTSTYEDPSTAKSSTYKPSEYMNIITTLRLYDFFMLQKTLADLNGVDLGEALVTPVKASGLGVGIREA